MSDWKKMTFGERHDLQSQCVPVSEKVFVEMAKNIDDREDRKKYVKEYGYYDNVTFFSNGEVHKDRPGVVGLVRTVPLPKEEIYHPHG